MTACPVDAISISPANAKTVSADLCVGCKLCMIACPFGTIHLNRDSKKAIKCDLCGGDPACVEACPHGAIEFMETPNQDWLGDFAEKRSSYNFTGLAGG
jgi:Fe-S-cluster-containing hydrogenase component 2